MPRHPTARRPTPRARDTRSIPQGIMSKYSHATATKRTHKQPERLGFHLPDLVGTSLKPIRLEADMPRLRENLRTTSIMGCGRVTSSLEWGTRISAFGAAKGRQWRTLRGRQKTVEGHSHRLQDCGRALAALVQRRGAVCRVRCNRWFGVGAFCFTRSYISSQVSALGEPICVLVLLAKQIA